jgi:glutamate-ammonia-ligase adenylyltransferase
MASLEKAGCLTHAEHVLLEENYAFLRKIEHRLQIMFDLQTHELPADEAELRKLAIRLGYADKPGLAAREAFQKDYEHRTEGNRRVLDHLLHDAFGDDARAEPEVDLVLDPDPPRQHVDEVLSRYRFRDVDLAYRNLVSLSTERIPFLSTRRCRHFLASNAPKLLRAVAETPDPDSTLVNLEKVSDSLGGKGVLWELFNFNPPTLRLYVELCATSPFLSSLLISNPGMIDELMDGLLLDKLPTLDWLRRTITELCRGAEDLQPILHSFKNTELLHIGVRDILAKEDIDATTEALTDVAQVCLEQIARDEYEKLVARLGRPTVAPPLEEGAPPHPRRGQPCELVVLALGKFGGGELGYYSDLDVIFLYDEEGRTVPRARGAAPTTNGHFFNELGQRIIKAATQLSSYGQLYEIDPRLRPTGRSGTLATSLDEFARYYGSGEGTIWERQALCRARVVLGAGDVRARAEKIIAAAALDHPFGREEAQAIRHMRLKLQETAAPGDLKRGVGGIVDIEFLVQLLQLRHGRKQPQLRIPNTAKALAALRDAGCISADRYEHLAASYRFLRKIESRLRLMFPTARDELPGEPADLAKLARNVGYASANKLLQECQSRREENRRIFETVVADGG